MAKGWIAEVDALLGEGKVVQDPAVVGKLSKDYYWYSPVLEEKLRDKVADGAVKARSEEDVAQTLSYAFKHGIPVTPRGGGTGNYGQAVPMDGGILLDVSGLNQIIEIGDGYARCQAGVKMGVLEKAARASGQELRIYPSTLMIATIGGFISGGSGGIGSIAYGTLWDDNVLEIVIYTMEEHPRRLSIQGEALKDYIHSYGTTGILTEVVIPLAPAREWQEAVCQFDRLEDALIFSKQVADDESLVKRMISLSEWPLPGYFSPLARHLESNSTAVLLETEKGGLAAIAKYAAAAGGHVGYVKEDSHTRKGVSLTDFTFNHTTLWAIKADPAYTYLQAGFSADDFLKQIGKVKARFGDEFLVHMEWIKAGGKLAPATMPIIRFLTEERLYEIISYLNEIGVSVNDPHTWVLDCSRATHPGMIARKQINDPSGLLNPGKLVASQD